MLKLLYNLTLVGLTFLSLPKFIWEMVCQGKHRKSFLEKLGLKMPPFSFPLKNMRVWVHSVSVGETKAIAPLIARFRDQYPHASIVLSTTTETGLAEARRSMPGLDQYFYLPFDFSWTIRRLVRRMSPDFLILVEGDFWYNLVSEVPNVILVNGKISKRSTRRFKLIPFFSHRLFSELDLLCVQNHHYAQRFQQLGVDPSKIVVTGNLKFDQPFPRIDIARWKKDLGITAEDRVVTIGSTHELEEGLLLTALEPLLHRFPSLKILLVPRHPERFSVVADLLHKRGIAFTRFSNHIHKQGDERIILIDAMGILSVCYQLSELAIVGGSFVTHVGGHNIFEPAALGVPVLFGPFMESQKDLVDAVLQGGAGIQLSLSQLSATVDQMLTDPPLKMRQAGLRLAEEVHGATLRTLGALRSFLPI